MAPGQQSARTLTPTMPERHIWAGCARAAGLGHRSHPRHAHPQPHGQRQHTARPGARRGRRQPRCLPRQRPRPSRPPRLRTGPTPGTPHARAGTHASAGSRARSGAPVPAGDTRAGSSRTPRAPLPARSRASRRRARAPCWGSRPPPRAAMHDPRATTGPGGARPRVGGTLTLDGALAGGVGRQQQHLAPLLGGHRWALPGCGGGCWARRRLRPPPRPAGGPGEGRAAAGGEAGPERLEAAGGGGGPAEHGGRRGSQLLAQRRDSPPRARHAPRRRSTRGPRERGETPGSAAPAAPPLGSVGKLRSPGAGRGLRPGAAGLLPPRPWDGRARNRARQAAVGRRGGVAISPARPPAGEGRPPPWRAPLWAPGQGDAPRRQREPFCPAAQPEGGGGAPRPGRAAPHQSEGPPRLPHRSTPRLQTRWKTPHSPAPRVRLRHKGEPWTGEGGGGKLGYCLLQAPTTR